MAKLEFNFTKQSIDDLPVPEPGKRIEAYDKKVPGLVVRVTSTGKRSFAVLKKVRGKTQRIKTGDYPSTTIEQARKQAKIKVGAMTEGHDLAEKKRTETRERRKVKIQQTTLGEAFEAYLKNRTLKPRTEYDYRETMRVTLGDWLNLPLTSITRTMIEERHRKRSKTSRARADHAMRVLRAIINYSMETLVDDQDEPIILSNPVKRLSAVKAWNPNTRKQTYVKPHQLPAWFDAVLNLDGESASVNGCLYRDYFQFLLLTGLRKNEAAKLKWLDVDLNDRSFVVSDTKNKYPHKLPLSDYLFDLLEGRKSNNEYVFQTSRDPGYPVDPRPAIEKVVAVSGISWTLHDLRRTFVTAAEKLDISLYSVKRLVNHHISKSDVTEGYVGWDVDRLRGPMQRITDYFLRSASIQPGAEIIQIRKGTQA